MHTKSLFSIILAGFVGCVTFCLSCKDKNCPAVLEYHLPVSVTPQQDTFNIGDTLFLSINFPKKLIDEQGDIENNFENFDFNIELRGYRYDVYDKTTSSLFSITSQIGTDTTLAFESFDLFSILPNFNGSDYQYKGLITFKQSGIFAINTYCYFDEYQNPAEITGNCDHLNVHFFCITNNGENNNVELVSPYTGNSTFWEEQFRLSGGFAFVVR